MDNTTQRKKWHLVFTHNKADGTEIDRLTLRVRLNPGETGEAREVQEFVDYARERCPTVEEAINIAVSKEIV